MALTSVTGSPSLGIFVAVIDRWTSCWSAKGLARAEYRRHLRDSIRRILDVHFESLPGNGQCTLSLYMIGRRETSARPTILIISNDIHIRKSAQKAIKESNVLQQYPEFRTKCMNKDPGSISIVPLACEDVVETRRKTPQSLEVLYDSSEPTRPTGLPIYVRHPSSVRPATANAFLVGTRLYLQTVSHAFHDSQITLNMAAMATTDDLVMDSDSESETDYNDELHIGITSAASQSLEAFPRTDSESLSIISTCSTPQTSAGYSSQDCSLSMGALTQALEEATPSTSFVPIVRTFAAQQPLQPSEVSLKSLGHAIEMSDENDWAVIEITAAGVEQELLSSLKHSDAPGVAYKNVATHPSDDAKVYAYMASGQKVSGVISDTCSYMRLQNGTCFRDVYVARLEIALLNGACGTILFDARTHETYGHLIGGCQRTGTAHILAAHQTATDIMRFRRMLTNFPKPAKLPPNASESLPSAIEHQENKEQPEMCEKLSIFDRAATTFSQAKHESAIPWKFRLSFAKKWDDEFSNDKIPKDTPYVDELKRFSPTREGILLFLEPYGGDTRSLDLEAVIRYCRDNLVSRIREQDKPGSAWMDDRTYASYYPTPTSAFIAASNDNSVLVEPEAPPMNQDMSRALHMDYADNASEHIFSPGVAGNSNASHRLPSNRYVPDSRRYPAPLPAELLFENLRKKRYNHPDLPDSDRRLVFIANPDGYDILAVTETAPQHLHEALGEFLEKYVSLRTCLKVRLLERGLPTYQLQYHLPHFALRKTKHLPNRHTAKLQRTRIDLSFMAPASQTSFSEEPLELIQAQISVVLCGTSETRYTVYCFEDNDHDDDREMGEDEFSEDGFQADQIARGEIDANLPIWNPREYFLVTLLERIKQVVGEWSRIVQVIEPAFEEFASIGRGPFFSGNIATASSWIRTMLQILRQLLRTIRETIKAWDNFISSNGDIGYFADLVTAPSASAKRIQRSLHQIHAAFDDMNSFNKKLLDVQEEIEKLERALEVRLMVEATRNTGATILFICPITVVSILFAIPTPSLTFPRNMWSFTGSVILITVVLYVLRFPTRVSFRHGPQLPARESAIQVKSGPRVIRRRATHAMSRFM